MSDGMTAAATYERFLARVREISTLGSIGGLLGWDQETYMPPKGAEARSRQLALVAGMAHEMFVSDETGDSIKELGELLDAGKLPEALGEPPDGPTPSRAEVNVREVRRQYERQTKLPGSLVEEITRTRSQAMGAWKQAKQDSDFATFAPWLQKNLDLQKQAAECFGYDENIYDALLDEFEPGTTVGQLTPMFDQLKERIVPLLADIRESGAGANTDISQRSWPTEGQKAFAVEMARAIGFDFDAGRLDTAPHPFSDGLAIGDVRITARYKEHIPLESVYCVMHEAGHGLYEQGLNPEDEGTPMANGVSYGIHESQSRLWENLVGRSKGFWQFALPHFQAAFPGLADDIDAETMYARANTAFKPVHGLQSGP